MTLPLATNWAATNSYTHTTENAVEAAINAVGAGTLVIPAMPTTSAAATLTLTTAADLYVHTGTGATWTLPPISAGTWQLALFNRGTGTVTVNADEGDQIIWGTVAVDSVPLASGASVQLTCDGTYIW